MRIYSLLIGINSVAFTAGCLAVVTCWQSTLTLGLTLGAFAILLTTLAAAWGARNIRNGCQQLADQLTSTDSEFHTTGIRDLDPVGKQIAQVIHQARQASRNDVVELEEIRQLLAKLDRRNDNFDRNGNPISPATRLTLILKGYGREFTSRINQTVSCGKEIRRAIEEIVSGSEGQADAVNLTTSVVEQLSSQIMFVCDHSEDALKASSKTRDTVKCGIDEFKKLIEELKQIRNHAAARERKLQALGQHTREIESIVQTIGTLSSRTDLLALNASIESVRAGEHGRGFAIVADEVRALAEQSAQAVLDINNRIEMIQLETHQSISVASSEHDQTHQFINRVSQTLDELVEVCDSAEESANRLTDISTAAQQQLHLTQEVVSSLEREEIICKQNRSRAEGVHWTSKTLEQVTTQLESSLELFRSSNSLPTENQHPAPPLLTDSSTCEPAALAGC